jgi:peptidylprolyl isomerase
MAEAKHGDKVKVQYTGKLADGRVFDSSVDKDPMVVTIGSEQTLVDLEQALIGMSPGESKTITIDAERAFGPHRKDLVANISSAHIDPDLKPEVGQRLEASQGDDKTSVVTVTAVDESGITVDGNHPLAGEDLIFDLELLEIS